MFDSSGLLTKEVLLGYVYGELSPSVREEVERHIKGDAMYQDVVEGLKEIKDKAEAERLIYSLNEQIAERSGAAADTGSIGYNFSEFISDYRKVAAALVGFLLLAGVVITLALLKESGSGGLANEQKKPQEEKTIQPSIAQKDTINIIEQDKFNGADALTTDDDEEIVSVFNGNALADSKESKQKAAENEKPTVGVAPEKIITKKEAPVTPSTYAEDLDEFAIVEKEQRSLQDSRSDVKVELKSLDERITTGASTKKSADDKNANVILQEEVFSQAEEMPQFPGGEAAMRQYIRTNLQYPKKAKNKNIQGKVYLNFTVSSTGKVKDVKVAQSLDKELDAEAVRIIESMPLWTPGKQNGIPVAVKQYLPIEFKLD